MTNRIILFRFHKNATVCASRIKRLKQQNPNIPIHGIGEQIDDIDKLFDAGMETLHVITTKPNRWKWLNGDLAIQHWFDNHGHNIDFDVLHLIEWDLVLTKPLPTLYPDIDTETVYLTGVVPVTTAKEQGWSAITGYRAHHAEIIKDFAENTWGTVTNQRTCLFPGTTLPRQFLEQMQGIRIPELVNDELRTATFADAMGLTIRDTGFYDSWKTDTVDKHFNCKNVEIDATVFSNTPLKNAYHPVRKLIEPPTKTTA